MVVDKSFEDYKKIKSKNVKLKKDLEKLSTKNSIAMQWLDKKAKRRKKKLKLRNNSL